MVLPIIVVIISFHPLAAIQLLPHTSSSARLIWAASMQHCVFCLGLVQDGDIGVGVLPQRQEIIVCGAGLGGVALQRVGSAELQMRECADGFVLYDAAMVQNFLKLGG